MKFFTFLFFFLCFYVLNSSAQTTGCQSNSSNTIYFTRNGTKNGVPNFDYRSNADRVPIGSAYCVNRGTNSTGSCYITSFVSTASDNPNGILVTFYFVNCPIDDNLVYLMILIGLFSVWVIRKTILQNTYLLL